MSGGGGWRGLMVKQRGARIPWVLGAQWTWPGATWQRDRLCPHRCSLLIWVWAVAAQAWKTSHYWIKARASLFMWARLSVTTFCSCIIPADTEWWAVIHHVCLQAKTSGLDDGDVYMSSYENRFRLFSSVEYEGQFYMTPLNFIESVTLNQPKSEWAAS